MTEKKVKLASLLANAERERDGEWGGAIHPELAAGGVRFKVRSLRYGPFQADLKQANLRFSRKYQNKPIPPEEAAKVDGELYAKHLLLDWDGFDEPYSPARAHELLILPAAHLLRTEIQALAEVVARTEVEFVEAVAGNSEPASDGN